MSLYGDHRERILNKTAGTFTLSESVKEFRVFNFKVINNNLAKTLSFTLC